jgi:ribosomal peptide maturation radical SAM protein 1
MTQDSMTALSAGTERHPVVATEVVLVMMPFGPVKMPSLGLSMLAQVLRDAGVSVRVEYPIVDFMRSLGERGFDLINNAFGKLSLGEWLFSRLVDPVGSTEDFLALSQESILPRQAAELRGVVEAALPAAARLVEETAARIQRLNPRIVGLSSSFQQQMSSIALAQRLRELMPDVTIVLGGANCSSPMGEAMFRAYPVLDAVLVGPGEIAFPRLVRAILDGEEHIRIPGVHWRRPGADAPPYQNPGVAPEPTMEDLPYAYYDDFYEIWPIDSPQRPMVPFEGSRGCWWGQKQHCVFCSLNHAMEYRSKSPERLYREIVHLNERYPALQLFATDDILDQRVIGSITDRLAALPVRPKLYYSVKSNLRKDQLRALAAAGVNAIQPGVESLADEVLMLMRKGVTGLRNLQLLKWSRELDIKVSWSILYGFPFDKAEYYDRMRAWLPSLTHLVPPRGITDVRIQRYSPLYSQAEHFGVKNLRPRPVYALIHKVDRELIDQLAYNFDWDPPEDQASYIEPLRKEVFAWMSAAKSKAPILVYVESGKGLVVGDTRPAAVRFIHHLDEVERAVCLTCDQVMKRHQIAAAVQKAGHAIDDDALDAVLARLVEDRLLLQHDDTFLFLACELQEGTMRSSDVVQLVLAEAG